MWTSTSWGPAPCSTPSWPPHSRRVPFGELLRIAEDHAGHGLVRVVPPDAADLELDLDPDARLGRDAASDVSLARRTLSWRPRPFREQASSYFAWASRNPAMFRPASTPLPR
ncbi:hypothetical protein [Microbispora triticiradicis]|uniref:hypothetical protein n=1 Tax=Microbispora TaxID=2005 RepID=UPI001FCB38BD|nr:MULTISPECIES: hypothetical protein [Microbispora]